MRLLHVSSAARRSGLDLLLVGFVAGIVLTMTALSVMKDGSGERQLTAVDAAGQMHVPLHHHHTHHHHHGSADDDVKVVDLAQQDRHKHAGIDVTSC